MALLSESLSNEPVCSVSHFAQYGGNTSPCSSKPRDSIGLASSDGICVVIDFANLVAARSSINRRGAYDLGNVRLSSLILTRRNVCASFTTCMNRGGVYYEKKSWPSRRFYFAGSTFDIPLRWRDHCLVLAQQVQSLGHVCTPNIALSLHQLWQLDPYF